MIFEGDYENPETEIPGLIAEGNEGGFAPQVPVSIEMELVGALVAQIFGYYQVAPEANPRLTDIQATLQDVADADCIIDLVDASGTPLGLPVTVSAGQRNGTIHLANPRMFFGGQAVRAQVLQAGSSAAPGQNLTLILLFA